jgi:Domain of unknown function (DUF4424)
MRAKRAGFLAGCAGLAAIAALATAAHANDSTAELRAGGLHLTRSDVIDMVSEDLFLSTKEVRVKYVYRNTSGADVTTRVAFPLPDIGWEFGEAPVALPDPASPNFVDFQTKVDGQDIPLEVEMRAIIDSGLDVTERVKAAGMPFLVTDYEAWDALQAKLPLTLAKELRDEGVVWLDLEPDTGAISYLRPRWTLKTTFHRMQTFPAGKDVVVEHVYKPVVGGSVGAAYVYAQAEEKAAIRKDYCIDGAFEGGLDRMKASAGKDELISERTMGYVLTTGANWAKPIGTFRLTIEKDSPEQLLTVCADGLKKTGPTRFELLRKDFSPEQDIKMMMLQRF